MNDTTSKPTSSPQQHSGNLVGIPPGHLASVAFNANPVPLHINGVREHQNQLFAWLDEAESAAEAAVLFQAYMAAEFELRAGGDRPVPGEQRRYRSSYLRLLKGWGFDSNSREGAVLKGWVESRFGIFPIFHKAPIPRFNSPAWIAYVEDKMSSRFHNNGIHQQLDLLYEFCQWALHRFFAPGQQHLRLYRGVNDFREQLLVERGKRRHAVLRLNNLVSFTRIRTVADEFGDYILEAQVPVSKILFFNELLSRHPLQGEAEYLVIGGDYPVEISTL